MTSEPRLGSPAQFELDRSGAQSKISGKIGVSGFPNRMVRFVRFSLHRWRVPAMEIGSTSSQAAYRRGKAWIMANLGASSGGDG
jgi:hypothetical protein